jgi:hypothetical protein
MLTSLNLNGCVDLTDGAVIALAASCPALETLQLAHCKHVTDASMEPLAGVDMLVLFVFSPAYWFACCLLRSVVDSRRLRTVARERLSQSAATVAS